MLTVPVTLILYNEKSVLKKHRVTHDYTQLNFQYPVRRWGQLIVCNCTDERIVYLLVRDTEFLCQMISIW